MGREILELLDTESRPGVVNIDTGSQPSVVNFNLLRFSVNLFFSDTFKPNL